MSAAPPPPPPPEPTGHGHGPYGSGPAQPPQSQSAPVPQSQSGPTPGQRSQPQPQQSEWAQPAQAGAADQSGSDAASAHTSTYGSADTGAGAYGPPSTGPYGASAYDQPNSPRGPVSTFFRALFDLKFEHFVTLKFSAIIYVLLIAYFVLIWLGSVIVGLIAVSQDAGGLVILLPALLLGWIPALISILLVRVGLEFLSAGIRTAINTGKLVEQR